MLYDDLVKRFPEDTIVQFSCLPTVNAQLALGRNDPSRAIETLQAAVPYELGSQSIATLYPAYVRGPAYLAAHQGNEAAAEFQKISDHRGRATKTLPLATQIMPPGEHFRFAPSFFRSLLG